MLLVATEVPLRRALVVGAVTMLVATGYASAGTRWIDTINLAPNHLRMIARPNDFANAADQARHPASSFEAWKRRYVIDLAKTRAFYFEEDAQTTVLAIDKGIRVGLFINGKPDASTGADLPTQVLLAHLPMFLAPEARSILVIGHGSGITAGSLMRHPVEQADVVEISAGVLNSDSIFAGFNYGVLDDPRVRTYLDDAQSFLRVVPRRYDMIISEPSSPWVAGIAGLFTSEFFDEMSARLNPGGLAVVWFHTNEQSDEGVELVMRTIGSVFPYAIVGRTPEYSDIIVIASNDPIEPDFEAMEDRFDQPEIRNDLARIGITNLASLILHYTLTQERFHEVLPAGPLNTRSRQRLEYSAPRSLFYHDKSSFLWRVDPLFRGIMPGDSTILGRYLSYRAAAGEPVRYEELEYLISRSYRRVAAALENLPLLPQALMQPPKRPARGLVPDPGTMGLFEAGFWSSRYLQEGYRDLASPYLQRFHSLNGTTGKQ